MNTEKIIDEIVALVTLVEEGNKDALKGFIALKRVGKILEDATNQIKEAAVTEAKKHGAKQFDFDGVTIQVKEGTARYSFKHIPQWSRRQEELKKLEEAAKNRYKNPSILMADEDGEEILPAQCTYDKESIAVTIPK